MKIKSIFIVAGVLKQKVESLIEKQNIMSEMRQLSEGVHVINGNS